MASDQSPPLIAHPSLNGAAKWSGLHYILPCWGAEMIIRVIFSMRKCQTEYPTLDILYSEFAIALSVASVLDYDDNRDI